MKKQDLFIKVLEWSYNKGSDGFTRNDLRDELKFGDDENFWINKVFITERHVNRKFFDVLKRKNGTTFYFLNEIGIQTYIDYIELKEARESSNRAIYIAIVSLLMTSFIGILQMFHPIDTWIEGVIFTIVLLTVFIFIIYFTTKKVR